VPCAPDGWATSLCRTDQSDQSATGLRANRPGAGKTGSMGAAHPQTPRRSPWQAFRGNPATPQDGKQRTNKTVRNPQSFSYEVSHLRGHGNTSRLSVPSYDNFASPPRAENRERSSLISDKGTSFILSFGTSALLQHNAVSDLRTMAKTSLRLI
jgi:hypothetical protein